MYKCYNIRCNSCMGKTLCTETGETALSCQDRMVKNKNVEDYKNLIGNQDFFSPAKIADWIWNATCAITDLLAHAEAAEARVEKAERERDAAVEDLRQMCVGGNTCAFCKHGRNCGKQGLGRKTVESCWEWRVQKEE